MDDPVREDDPKPPEGLFEATTKTITVAQPWAALILSGAKTILDRPAPPKGPMRPEGARGTSGAVLERGERIAIHAAASRPAPVAGYRSWEALSSWWLHDERNPDDVPATELRLGAVLGTVVVLNACPVGGPRAFRTGSVEGDEGDFPGRPVLVYYDSLPLGGEALVLDVPDTKVTEVTDQLTLGDFAPGRWGWLVADPQPFRSSARASGRAGVWLWQDSR